MTKRGRTFPEREDLPGEGEAQGDQDVDPIDWPSANNRPESNRTSVASYNSSLRRAPRDLGLIISSSSAMSHMPSMLISAVPESAEMDDSKFSESMPERWPCHGSGRRGLSIRGQ
ncbi:hypothetical protein ABVK25_005612 [Lepraria finkii]|uniref:Uncharacterized protein n=1 Tax=Lepraria finkii TaxID=1340010 RepID=A0ABR4B890_9LECA